MKNNIVKILKKDTVTTLCMIWFCLLCCFNKVIAQSEFAPIGAEWYYTYTFGCCPEEHFNRVVSEKDTVIDENNCRVLRLYYDNSNVANEKYVIKQEKGKIYYYYQDKFNLLFDCDVEINDTVKFTFMYKMYNNDFPLGKDTLFSARYQVEAITISDEILKTFKTKVLEEDILDFWGIPVPPYGYHTYLYTEKIGLKNLLGSPLHHKFIPVFDNIPHPAIENYRWLRCYSDDDYFFISDKWEEIGLPCDYPYITNIVAPKSEDMINIHPNPFDDKIVIFTKKGNAITIFDVHGKVIYFSELFYGENIISTHHFPKGIYFVNIQNKDGYNKTFKMIKL